MKLVTFSVRGRRSIGKVAGAQVIDLAASDAALPSTMLELLQAGPAAMERVRALEAAGAVTWPLADVRLEAPVPNPSKFLAIGMNYKKHVQEAIELGVKVPDSQVWFNKQVSCVNGPFDPVQLPFASTQLDYEAELGVVIGRRCRHVSVQDAPSVVAGYTIVNDVSARDWQMRSPTMTLGKSFNTHGPFGPWLVTPDEIGDPHGLRLRTLVNGEVRQDDNTRDMIYNVWEQIAYLSTVMTLEPGDVLATGTPSGVAVAMKPPRFVQVGDVMRVEIERIGHIEALVVAEPR
ncbi:MAG TPA: fumarylacetoacetate hydrolase family protein [Rubrivivax sp.]|nr:fumarylacetoacetate hydrolase family protein [Rubrivivax sp.]